jgi:AcrR family transcriptional regulator
MLAPESYVSTESTHRSDARLNRERVLQAAREVLAERGVDAEMKEIADRAGVGVGTVYRNFSTKEELIEAMLGQVLQGLYEAVDEAERMDDPRDGLLHLFRAGCEIVENHGELVAALVQVGYRKGEHAAHLVERGHRFIARGVRMGAFRSDVPAAFLVDYMDASMPFLYWRAREKWSREEATRYCEQVIMSALTAGPWPASSPKA